MKESLHGFFIRKYYTYTLLFLSFLLAGSLSVSAQTTILVPFSGNNAVACGTNVTLQDHAGTGDYANNANGYTVLNNANTGVITISGTYAMKICCDQLSIYTGSTGAVGGTLLQQYGSAGSGSVSFTSAPGQTVSVVFTSDVSVVNTGFSLSVTYSGSCVACTATLVPFSGSNAVGLWYKYRPQRPCL